MPERKPHDDELDAFGITHTGKVRPTNQDHFLLGSLRQRFELRQSSLPELDQLPIVEDRVASIIMVADGVGGGQKGDKASQLAVEELTQYVNESARCYYHNDRSDESFVHDLEQAALKCHRAVMERGASDPDSSGMATTLTLMIIIWPWTYVLQVGDSRYYEYKNGTLTQISHDQTLAQELIDSGVFAAAVRNTPLANVLSSSIGGSQTAPVVTRVPTTWNTVHLLCSDGLTKHVSDEKIAERLRTMTSARQACEQLLQDALDGGGTDNITICIGRAVKKGQPT
jgi:serine/threonine protein phosphatase PrpC